MTLGKRLSDALKDDPIRYRVGLIEADMFGGILGGPEMKWHVGTDGEAYSVATRDEAEITAAILNAMFTQGGRPQTFAVVCPFAAMAGEIARQEAERQNLKGGIMTTITIGISRPGKPPLPLVLPAALSLGDQANIVTAAQALVRLSREHRALLLKMLGREDDH